MDRRAGVDTMQIEYLMGHMVGDSAAGVTKLMMAYDPSEAQELLNEYLKAANFLTMDESNRLKVKVEKLEKEKSIWAGEAAELDDVVSKLKAKGLH